MNVFVRYSVLIMFIWLMLVGVCLGKQVYLKDGGIIDSQSAWRKGKTVFVKVNRDIVAEFNLNEIDLKRTFPQKTPHSRHQRHNLSDRTTPTAAKPAAAATKPAAPLSGRPAGALQGMVDRRSTHPDTGERIRRILSAA